MGLLIICLMAWKKFFCWPLPGEGNCYAVVYYIKADGFQGFFEHFADIGFNEDDHNPLPAHDFS